MKIYRCGTAYILAANIIQAKKIQLMNGMVGELSEFKRPLKRAV